MTPNEHQRLSIAICNLLAVTPADPPVNRRALIKDLGPKFEAVSLEDLSDAITRHCEALDRKLDSKRRRSADLKRPRRLKPYKRVRGGQ
jgi:hypothetical protein